MILAIFELGFGFGLEVELEMVLEVILKA